MEMLAELNTKWQISVNHDESLTEPAVFLLVPKIVNGSSSGIAAGMATNIPPHNLGEVTNAVRMMIENP